MPQIALHLDDPLSSELKDAAARLGVTRSTFVRASIRRYLSETDDDLMAAMDDPELRPVVAAERRRAKASEIRAQLQKEIA